MGYRRVASHAQPLDHRLQLLKLTSQVSTLMTQADLTPTLASFIKRLLMRLQNIKDGPVPILVRNSVFLLKRKVERLPFQKQAFEIVRQLFIAMVDKQLDTWDSGQQMLSPIVRLINRLLQLHHGEIEEVD